MPGLVDIAPVRETVMIHDQPVEVRGFSFRAFGAVLAQSVDLQKLMANVSSFDLNQLFSDAPDAIAKLIAAATGSLGDAEAEEVAADLMMGDQMLILETAMRLTMPGGAILPFVQRAIRLLGLDDGSVNGAAVLSRAPDGTLPSRLTN